MGSKEKRENMQQKTWGWDPNLMATTYVMPSLLQNVSLSTTDEGTVLCQRKQHLLLGLTWHSQESPVPPSCPAADRSPGASVRCEAADATPTAHWTGHCGLLKARVVWSNQPIWCRQRAGFSTNSLLDLNMLFCTCSSELVPTSWYRRGLKTRWRPLLQRKRGNKKHYVFCFFSWLASSSLSTFRCQRF